MMMAEKKFKKIGSTGEATSILGLNDKILNFNLAGNLYWEAVDRILELEAEVKEYKQSFNLQYDASMRGIKMWQEATGRDMVWPDKADLTVWLIEKLESLQARYQGVSDAVSVLHSWMADDLETIQKLKKENKQLQKALEEKERTLQLVDQITKRIEFKMENLVRSYKLLISRQPEESVSGETVLANYFISDEFRNTLHSIIDEQEEGEWITLIHYHPEQGE